METVLKLYTYIDGINDVPFPNEEFQVVASEFRCDYKRMGAVPTISCTIMYNECLDNIWTDNVYATFNGEKFFIKQVPTSSFDNNDARYRHDVELVSERIILDNVYVYDVVSEDVSNDKPVSNTSSFSFFGTIHEFVQRLNYSLNYSKLDYTIVVDDGISSEGKLISFENQFFSNALQEIYNTYEIPYYFSGKVIHVGFTDNAITHTFKYGVNESLLSIQKQNANAKIINRITGIGSADNIPYYYPNTDEKGIVSLKYNLLDDIAYISNPTKFKKVKISDLFSYHDLGEGDVYVGWVRNYKETVNLEDYGIGIKRNPVNGDGITFVRLSYIQPQPNLMPSIYRESLGKERFYNAKNNSYKIPDSESYYEFDNPYVDGKPKEHIVNLEHIKPSIVGMTNANGLRIDMFSKFAFDANDNDDTDDEGKYIHPYFFGKLRKFDGDYGFNLFDHSIDEGEMTIAMTSGSCGGCEFVIGVDNETQKNLVQVDANGNLLRDEYGDVRCGREGKPSESPQDKQNDTINNEVWIALRKDENTFGVLMPNASNNYKPSVDDYFVILYIDLPQAYILNAEKKLEEEIIKYMSLNNDEKFTFSISFSRIFFAENPSILEQLNENARIQIEYNEVKYELYVSSFSYAMTKDVPLPEIKVELSDKLAISQNALQTAINDVKSEVISSVGSIDMLKQGLRYFLRKDKDDSTKHNFGVGKDLSVGGKINTQKGINVGNFTEGTLGSGASMHMDEDGNTYVESDYLKIRKKATFTNVTVQELKHIGGELVLSPAYMVCSRMEEVDDGYKCYFNQTDSDGHKVYNEFEVGDQGRCQTFNLEHNTYYWRLVTSIGDDFIILSKTDCDTGSDIPKAGDNISQLGNRNDATRQSAIILSAYGEDAPSYKQYKGIDSYVLSEDMRVTRLSPKGNELTGKFTIESGSKGWENLEGLEDTINNQSSNLEEFVHAVNKEFENVRNEMDGAIDTWFGEEEPTLSNYPAIDWLTDEDKDSHLGDLYYSDEGKAYRFQYKDGAYLWVVIEDSEVVKALELAQKALDTADGKRRVFITQPVPPYDLGDLWAGGEDSSLMRCVRKRESGSFYQSDWDFADNSKKYADAVKLALEEEINNVKSEVDNTIDMALEASKDYTDETKADIQKSVDALLLEKANVDDVYSKAVVDGMVTDAEAEAIRQANQVAKAQRELLEIKVNAYADGKVTEAEQRAIDEAERMVEEAKSEFHASITATKNDIDKSISDVQDAMTGYTDEAKTALQQSIDELERAKASVDDVYDKAMVDGMITDSEEKTTKKAKEYADAAQALAELNIKAWADGEISEAEQNAINEAQARVDAAKEELELAIKAQEVNLGDFVDSVTKEFEDIRKELDGAVDTWFGDEEPTLTNFPAVDWVTDTDKDGHLGDLYYSDSGKAYRFQYKDTNGYYWKEIVDSDAVEALRIAKDALDTADRKRTIFTVQPYTPYQLGDLWAGGEDEPLKRCINGKESGAFDEADWDLADNSKKYADAIKKELADEVRKVEADTERAITDAIEETKNYTDEAKKAIQITLDALEHDKANAADVYKKALVDGMISNAEANAIREANEMARVERELLEVQIKAWADGEISDAEQRAIDEAQSKVDAAKEELEEAMDTLEAGLNDKMDNLVYGKNNLLLNSGFTGDFVTSSLLGGSSLWGDSKMFSPSLKYWSSRFVSARSSDESESSVEAVIEDGGFLSQSLESRIIDGESYIFSFRGKGGSIIFTLGNVTNIFELGDEWGLYVFKFVVDGSSDSGSVFRIEADGKCVVCELQLERGTIRSSWGMSPLDNRSDLAKYESLTYLRNLLKPGVNTTIEGGTINTGLITMGKADDDGDLSETTAGVSGQYMDDNSVAYWAGGDWKKAIYTVVTYLDNPNHTPSDEELRNMAHFVVTHGGRAILNDVILRGYIYALGGKFKGEVEATSGIFNGSITAKSMNLSVTDGGNKDNPIDLTTSSGFRLDGYHRLPLLKNNMFTELVGLWVSPASRIPISCTIVCNDSLIEVLYYNGTIYHGVSQINISHSGGFIKASMIGHQYSEWGGQCWSLNIEKSEDIIVEIISQK